MTPSSLDRIGEVPAELDGTEERQQRHSEIESILQFRPDRLGHALLIPNDLWPALQSSGIPVECCPTSNVMTIDLADGIHSSTDKLTEGLQRHPHLKTWLESDYPMSCSTDDFGVFDTTPSQELFLLRRAFGLGMDRLWKIGMDSIDHAFCDNELKGRLKLAMKTKSVGTSRAPFIISADNVKNDLVQNKATKTSTSANKAATVAAGQL